MKAKFGTRLGRVNLVSLLSLPVVVGTLLLFLAASSTLQVTANETLSQYWRSSYDILVRPANSRSHIEENYNLVRANFLSGMSGGVTQAQYVAIRALPEVEIAAPVAMVGYRDQEPTVINLEYTHPLVDSEGEYIGEYYLERGQYLDDGAQIRVYSDTVEGIQPPIAFPIAPWETWPVLLAAVDPQQEAMLTGLDATLQPGDSFLEDAVADAALAGPEGVAEDENVEVFPQLLNIQSSFVVTRTVKLYRVEGQSPMWARTFQPNDPNLKVHHFLEVRNPKGALQSIYGHNWERCEFKIPTAVSYEPIGSPAFLGTDDLVLQAIPVALWQLEVNPSELQATYLGGDYLDEEDSYLLGEPEVAFRPQYLYTTQDCFQVDSSLTQINLVVVGYYNSEQLFHAKERLLHNIPLGTTHPLSPEEKAELVRSSLNRLPFETYFLPETVLKYHPDGTPVNPPLQLRPTFNSQGYLATPPTALTTLEAARFLLEREDYISAIRVRVDDVGTLDAEAQAKIQRVAEQIVEQTGLEVDIMAGTSPKSVYVYLPGYEDIPPLGWVEEQWVQKGVTTAVSRGFRRADLLLSSAVFGVVGLFLVTSQLLSVLGRTRQWGILRALGWRATTLFRTVLQEALVLGILAGLLALAGGFVAIRYLGLEVPLARLSLLMPVALALYGGGALYPAWRASRMAPIAAVQQGELSGRGPRLGRLSLLGYGLRHLGQQRLRTVLLLLQLTLASALAVLLGAVLIAVQGELYGNLLGQHLYTKVGPTQLAQAGLGLLLAALAVAEVLRTSVAERRREIGVLKALGWRSRTLLRAIMSEAALLGLVGGTLGAVLGTGAFWALYRELPQELLWVVPGGVLLCILVSVLAALWPALQAARIPPAEAVRYE